MTRRMRTVASFMLMVEVSGYREEEARVERKMGSGSCVDVMSINVGPREYRRCGGTTDVGRKSR